MSSLTPAEHFGLRRVSRCPCVCWYRPGPAAEATSTLTGQTTVYLLHGYQPYQTTYFGDLLYIGVSDQPGFRWETHRKQKPWWSDVVMIQQRICFSREEALTHEAELIEALDPLYNRTGSHHNRREDQRLRNKERLPLAVAALANRLSLPD